MKALRFALVALARDWKSGELAVLFGALLVAVTALTAVGFFTSRISQAITQQAGEDACRKPLVVEAAGPIANRVAVAMHAAVPVRTGANGVPQATRPGGSRVAASPVPRRTRPRCRCACKPSRMSARPSSTPR